MNFLRNNKPLIAFAILAIAVIFAMGKAAEHDAQSLWEANVASCERVNKLRTATNHQAEAFRSFVTEAVTARQMTADTADNEAERRANAAIADRYREILTLIKTVPLTDCKEAFPEP